MKCEESFEKISIFAVRYLPPAYTELLVRKLRNIKLYSCLLYLNPCSYLGFPKKSCTANYSYRNKITPILFF